MKKMKIALLALLTLFFGAGQALANDPGRCGLPAMVLDSKPLNIISNFSTFMYTYTLAVTVGTSKCDGLSALEMEREVYVQNSLENISEEVAQGGGDHLNALATLMGCQNSQEAFTSVNQAKFQSLYGDAPSARTLIERLKSEVKGNVALSQCQPLG